MTGTGELYLAQHDGGPPALLASGSAPGESGVSVLSMRFEAGAHFNATPQQHLICFQMSQLAIECRIAGQTRWHAPAAGSLVVCPAGIDCAADTDQSVDLVMVAIDPSQFALSAAESSAVGTRLVEQFAGWDRALLRLAKGLVHETADRYPNGALFWNDVANQFIHGLISRHGSARPDPVRGRLGKDVLHRLKDYVLAHLHEPIAVDALAAIAGHSPFHFTRVFARTVGVTPHRYVVHLRLQRAMELLRGDRSGFADIAARTGFADQSHLSRWMRRVHGVSLTQVVI